MKKVFMIIAAMCMTSIMASAQKTIRVSTDKTDLVMQVSPKGRLYQVYLGDKLKNPSDYNHLKWDGTNTRTSTSSSTTKSSVERSRRNMHM
jgi:alpha-galactosidase